MCDALTTRERKINLMKLRTMDQSVQCADEEGTEDEPSSAAMNEMCAHQLQSDEVLYVNVGESRQKPLFVDQSTPSIFFVFIFMLITMTINYGNCYYF